MAMVSEFVSAINQVAAERGINPEEVFQALEAAILIAYKKEHFKDDDHYYLVLLLLASQ